MHELDPIGLADVGHIQFFLVTTFWLELSKLKFDGKVDLEPEHLLTWSKGGSFGNNTAISHYQNRQVTIPILFIL